MLNVYFNATKSLGYKAISCNDKDDEGLLLSTWIHISSFVNIITCLLLIFPKFEHLNNKIGTNLIFKGKQPVWVVRQPNDVKFTLFINYVWLDHQGCKPMEIRSI